MGDRTNIEWCDATWNVIRGCSRVSEGGREEERLNMLTEREELILDILCERRYAYLGEVVREAEIASEEAERTLRTLADLGYVRRYQGRHGLRYGITAAGRQAAVRPNPEVWTA